jgi:hypothetical protein
MNKLQDRLSRLIRARQPSPSSSPSITLLAYEVHLAWAQTQALGIACSEEPLILASGHSFSVCRVQ